MVALDKPGERESSQWYFQRDIAHLPAAGEMVFFDRSWYNRAGVERVMGFCSAPKYLQFLRQAPMFEQMLVEDGVHLIKLWFSVSASAVADGDAHARLTMSSSGIGHLRLLGTAG